MTAAIEIKNLSYSYKSDWTFRRSAANAVDSLSIEVLPGEAFGFLGHNGAGKTTTIKCLLGLIKSRSGSTKIFGKDSRLPETRNLVGYLPEEPYFYDHLKVREMLTMFATLLGISKNKIEEEIDKQIKDNLAGTGLEESRVSPRKIRVRKYVFN